MPDRPRESGLRLVTPKLTLACAGHRSRPARRVMTTLPHPLPVQPADHGARVRAASDRHTRPHDLRQPDTDAVRAQFDRVMATVEAKFPVAAEHLDTTRDNLVASTGFPCGIWRQI